MFSKLIERVIDILYEYQSHHSFKNLENIKVVLKESVKKINIKHCLQNDIVKFLNVYKFFFSMQNFNFVLS